MTNTLTFDSSAGGTSYIDNGFLFAVNGLRGGLSGGLSVGGGSLNYDFAHNSLTISHGGTPFDLTSLDLDEGNVIDRGEGSDNARYRVVGFDVTYANGKTDYFETDVDNVSGLETISLNLVDVKSITLVPSSIFASGSLKIDNLAYGFANPGQIDFTHSTTVNDNSVLSQGYTLSIDPQYVQPGSPFFGADTYGDRGTGDYVSASLSYVPIILTPDKGGTFGVASVDLDVAYNYGPPSQGGEQLYETITGTFADGHTEDFVAALDGYDGFETFVLPNSFGAGLVNLTFQPLGSNSLLIDNIVFGASPPGLALNGTPGDDHIQGVQGAPGHVVIIDGQAGVDLLDFGSSAGGVVANMATGIASGTDVNVHFVNVENLTGGSHDDQLTGDARNNVLDGGAGNDQLYGGAGADKLYGGDGNDYLDGGIGADVLDGGAGNDRIVYDAADYSVQGGAGNDTLILLGGATVDLSNAAVSAIAGKSVFGFENVDASASSGAVTLTGSAYNNILIGGSGNDTLHGGAGYDQLSGGAGDDYIDGGADADTIDGGAGNDTIVYDAADYSVQGGAGIDTLVLLGGATVDLGNTSGSQIAGKSVFGFENVDASASSVAVTLTGSAGNNILTGGSGNDILKGGAGYDKLFGGAGDDYIDGGADADTIDGGAGNDRIVYDAADYSVQGGAGNDTLVLLGGATVNLANMSSSQIAGKSVFGFENVDASGSSQAVTLTGSAFANVLIGGSGADTLQGGGGGDQLTGGAGADTFLFKAVSDSTPASMTRITDFNSVEGDHINLAAIDARASTGVDDPFTWIGTAAFHHVEGELRYATVAGGYAIVQGDINGDGVADFTVRLDGVSVLHASDFIL